jgi:hypothetical protein
MIQWVFVGDLMRILVFLNNEKDVSFGFVVLTVRYIQSMLKQHFFESASHMLL